jgi:PmbA protein
MPEAIDPAIYAMLENIVAQAKARGATDAVASFAREESLEVETREGKIEAIKGPVSNQVGITVYFNRKSGASSVKSLAAPDIAKALDIAIENAGLATDNPYAGLPAPGQVPQVLPDSQIYDSAKPTFAELAAQAMAAERAALAVDPRIEPGDKSGADWSRRTTAIVASNGFKGGYMKSISSVGAQIIAHDSQGRRETNGESSAARFRADLRTPEEVGQKAARDLIAKLDAQSPPATGGSVPVVFSPDAARQLMSIFADAVAGNAVVRGMTFLGGKKDQQVFPADISIVDDPTLAHGFGSLPVDGDGIVPQKLALVENGVLKHFLLGLKAARQIEAESGVQTASNGHAGGATNLILKSSSAVPPDQLIAGIAEGFYVTEIQGHDADITAGEFSEAARGRWIKNGQLAQPIKDATIAGKLSDMFGTLQAANDVDLGRPESGILTPTVRVDGMTVGG